MIRYLFFILIRVIFYSDSHDFLFGVFSVHPRTKPRLAQVCVRHHVSLLRHVFVCVRSMEA